jgi:hypothetical protein
MTNQEIFLMQKANNFGLQGYKVIAWIPPQSAGDNPDGTFILQKEENK